MLASMTNSPTFLTNKFPYTIKITENATNAVAHQVDDIEKMTDTSRRDNRIELLKVRLLTGEAILFPQ